MMMNTSAQRARLGDVRARGWIQRQIRDDLDHGFAGILDELTMRIRQDLFAERITSWSPNHNGAGMHVSDGQESRPYDLEGDPDVHWWDAETRGNWLWGTLMMGHLADHQGQVDRSTRLVQDLLATQDPDGYLGIYQQQSRYAHLDIENGELWAQSRALLVLLACSEATGDAACLAAARRAADLTLAKVGPGIATHFHRPTPMHDLTGMTHGLNYVDAMSRLTDLTGDMRYLAFGQWLYADFCAQIPFQNDDMALGNILDPTRPLSSHAAHTAEHFRAVLIAGEGTEPIEAGLRKLRLFSVPSGALIGDESVHGVPTPDSGYEICTMVEQLWSLCEALRVTEQAWIGDWVENLLFNALQGARSADGRDVSYLTADDRLQARIERPDVYALIQDGIGRYKVSPTHEDIATCCVANLTRANAHYLQGAWFVSGDVVTAALHGPSAFTARIDDIVVRIEATSQYPFEDVLRYVVSVDQSVAFTLRVRRPGWVTEAQGDTPGWWEVSRTWSDGDEVTFDLPCVPRIVEYATGEVAIHRGALQFVQPIASREHVLKEYPIPGFRDAELLPTDVAALACYPVLPADVQAGLRVERNEEASLDAPWAHAPLRLVGAVTLVPMGTTRLRRAAMMVDPGG